MNWMKVDIKKWAIFGVVMTVIQGVAIFLLAAVLSALLMAAGISMTAITGGISTILGAAGTATILVFLIFGLVINIGLWVLAGWISGFTSPLLKNYPVLKEPVVLVAFPYVVVLTLISVVVNPLMAVLAPIQLLLTLIVTVVMLWIIFFVLKLFGKSNWIPVA